MIYNLPNEDVMSIMVRIFYLITVMGSFVLLSQPVFRVIESTMLYKTGRCCQPSPEEQAEIDAEKEWEKKKAAKNLEGGKEGEGDDVNPEENPKASGV